MCEQYRGYRIVVSRSAEWSAVLVELHSGATLPTKATSSLGEGPLQALLRARALADIYSAATAQAA